MLKIIRNIILCVAIVIGSSFVFNMLQDYQNERRFKSFHDEPVKTRIVIPTYNQKKEGYPLGCEGVSLYMAMRGMGYLEGMSLKEFMDTMPIAENPLFGYWGDPTQGRKFNGDKRTTIYPEPLAAWGSSLSDGHVKNLTGATTEQLKEELDEGHPIVVYITSGWNAPKWKTYFFGTAVTNNHATCLVGYNQSGDYLINDCSGSRCGEYWITKDLFESRYNVRHMAVSVTGEAIEQPSETSDDGKFIKTFINQAY